MSTQLTKADSKKLDIRQYIQSDTVKQQIAMVLPKHLTPERMARVACTAILKTPKLLECRPESLLQALMTCSQAGLEPDGRNAHLIPYGDQVQVIFDYKGLVALAERNGVECIYADKVCENDDFDAWVEEGEKKLRHKVNWKTDRGEAYAYYASCRRNGRLDYEVMTKADVESIRMRSRAKDNGPWKTDYDEMAKKTVLRRMSKRWDLSSEIAETVYADDDNPVLTNKVKAPIFAEPTMPIVEELPPPAPPAPAQAPVKEPTNTPAKQSEFAPGGVPTADIESAISPQLGALYELMVEYGVTEAQLVKFCQETPGFLTPQQTSLQDLPASKCEKLTKAMPNIVARIKLQTP